MKYFIYSIAILLSSLLGYFVSYNLIFTILIFLLFTIYFIILEFPLRKKLLPKIIKKHDLNIFLHDFLLAYLDNSNIKFCLKIANKNISKSLQEELRLLDEYSGEAILNNLDNYFSNPLYSLFLISLKGKKENQIENIKFILNENTLVIKKRDELHEKNKKALFEFILLWLVSFIIFAILRISLNNYFNNLKNSFYYLTGISLYFITFFLSINLFNLIYFRRENV